MYSNILVPVASGEAELCDAPLKIAASLAAPDAKITLVHVFESLPDYVAQQVPAEVLNSNRKEVIAGIEAAAAKIDGARVVLLDGSPGRTISEYAAQDGPSGHGIAPARYGGYPVGGPRPALWCAMCPARCMWCGRGLR